MSTIVHFQHINLNPKSLPSTSSMDESGLNASLGKQQDDNKMSAKRRSLQLKIRDLFRLATHEERKKVRERRKSSSQIIRNLQVRTFERSIARKLIRTVTFERSMLGT